MSSRGERPDTWIALDFETATSERFSACSLGIAVIEDGEVTGTHDWLIRPPRNRYDGRNISVHGIRPAQTESAGSYRDLYPLIEPFLSGRQLLAHWAPFDVSVLRALHEYYRIPLPAALYVCSCRMAQRAFPQLHNHRLPTVCDHCGIELQHHDAASDALACAHVTIGCKDAAGAASIHEAVRTLGVTTGTL